MSESIGTSVALSPPRRVICDLMHACQGAPFIPIQKDIDVSVLAALRQAATPKPSWCAIFTKAYGKVVAARSDLRRAYLTFPFERLFEYRETSVQIAMQATVASESAVVFAQLQKPESLPLAEIDRLLAWSKAEPIERLPRYRRALKLASYPRWLRRLVWWYCLNVSASRRGRYVSTYGVSSMANWGVDSLRPLAPCTTLLHYGVIDTQGKVAMRMTFDHRVIDGHGACTALQEMEQVLRTDMVAELQLLAADAQLKRAG